jgi:hypothetical protein
VIDSCEHGNGPSGSIKDGKFLGHLSNFQLFKDSVIYSITFNVR